MNEYLKPLSILLLLSITAICEARSVQTTPSSIILGKTSGDILRCLYNDTGNCSTIYNEESSVNSVAVSGEFFYIGLESGVIKRCHLNETSGTCVEFHSTNSAVKSLSIMGKFIYAGLSEGGMLKCGLRESEKCKKFTEEITEFDSFFEEYMYISFEENTTSVDSVAVYGDHVYFSSNESIFRCTLDKAECAEFFNSTSPLNAISFSGNHLYAGSADGIILKCDINALNTTENCQSVYNACHEIVALEIHGSHLQAVINDEAFVNENLLRCDLQDFSCERFGSPNYKDAVSIASIYETVGLYRYFKGENLACVWQWDNCPPYVIYYDIESRAAIELHVKNNKVYTSVGKLFDTSYASMCHSGSKAIFVMEPAGRIYASNQHPVLLLHHSSFIGGHQVAAAGEIEVYDGVIKSISSCSGHYRPSINVTKQVVQSLKIKGYDKDFKLIDCSRRALLIDFYYRRVEGNQIGYYNESVFDEDVIDF